MPRQLRIEYAGAFYHVYSRGNLKQPIFFSDDDRSFFLKLLREARERLDAIWHLFCLMENHYHLGLETPGANLSQIMHFLNSSYSIYFNVKHKRSGHLFQGRFKAILVQTEVYARTLTTYIHCNPVWKGLSVSPEDHEWSSCRVYYGLRRPPFWLETRTITGFFGDSLETLRTEHQAYLDSKEDPGHKTFRKAAPIGILGDEGFVDKIRRTYLSERLQDVDGEVCELKRLKTRPELSKIKGVVEEEAGGQNRLIKKCTIFLAHKYSNYRLWEIGAFFGTGSPAASTAYRKMAVEIGTSPTLERIINRARRRLFEEAVAPEIEEI